MSPWFYMKMLPRGQISNCSRAKCERRQRSYWTLANKWGWAFPKGRLCDIYRLVWKARRLHWLLKISYQYGSATPYFLMKSVSPNNFARSILLFVPVYYSWRYTDTHSMEYVRRFIAARVLQRKESYNRQIQLLAATVMWMRPYDWILWNSLAKQ